MRKRNFLVVFTAIAMMFVLTGCGNEATSSNTNDNNTTNSGTKVEESKKTKGNCDVFECIQKIETDNTLEEVNNLVGFDGEKTNEGNGWITYDWEITEDSTLSVTFYESSSTCNVEIEFDDDLIKNKKVDFSKYEEVKSALQKGETLTYDDLKEKFGGVDGTLIEKSTGSNRYKWVNSQGGYLNVSFSNQTKKCTMIMGRF